MFFKNHGVKKDRSCSIFWKFMTARNNEQKIPAAKSVEGKAVVVRVIVLDTES